MAKLEKPPHLPHWVRYNLQNKEETKSRLVEFALNSPRYTYSHGMKLIHDRLHLNVDWDTLKKSAERGGRENSRPLVLELLDAFENFEADYPLCGLKNFDMEVFPWRVSRDIFVPVKPLISLVQNGKLEPVFVVGWASMPLIDYQMRLLMTVLEDAVFSLEDFSGSSGHFITLPRGKPTKLNPKGVRTGQVWKRGDFELLPDTEVQNQVEIFLSALEEAKKEVAGRDGQHKDSKTTTTPPKDNRQTLFKF